MLPLLLLAPALAAAPAWRWPAAEPRAYAFDTCVQLPEPLALRADQNLEARSDRLQLQLVASCEPATEEPAGWQLVCSLRDVSLRALPLPGDEAALPAVLTELDGKLTGALVELVMQRDGRFRKVELHLEGRDRKAARTRQTLEWLLERALYGLELTLPTGEETAWGTSAPGLLSYLPRAKSLGATRMQHEATPTPEGSAWVVRSRGRGVVQADALTLETGLGAPGSLSLALSAESEARFDLAEGALDARRWAMFGRVTPSAVFDELLMRHPYATGGALQRLRPGESATLAESGPLGAEASGACQAMDAALPGLEAALEHPL